MQARLRTRNKLAHYIFESTGIAHHMNQVARVFLLCATVKCQGFEDDECRDVSVMHGLDGNASITEHFRLNFSRLVPVMHNFHVLY